MDTVIDRFLEYAKIKTKLHANISPTQHNWVGTSAGIRGLSYNYSIRKDGSQVELYIDRGEDSDAINKNIFDQLFEHQAEIETTFGGKLEWQSLEGKRACRIRKKLESGGYRDENWETIHEDMAENMIRLEKALGPFIKKLEIYSL